MAYKVADRVKETTVVTGTGPATLLGAVSGYRTFASQLSIGDTCAYAIVNANASEWEVGIGTYSAVNTLTRTTVHASTNSNAVVNFSAGTKDVFLSPTAETVLSDVTSTDGTVTLTKTGSIVDLSVAVAAATTNVIVQVRNNTGATLTKGTVVYINGSTGQLPTVTKAIATSDATSAQTLGMISADLNDNSNGYVTIIGLIDDVDTKGYAAGTQLYLSGTVPGEFTNVKPYAPIHLVYVGVVERATVHGKIFVKVQNGYEMDELHNVDAYNPSNGDLLIYNTSTNLWAHSPQSSLTVAPSQVTGTAVITSDSRLSDSRTPTGSAGGVLAGTYPNPSFASTTGSGSVVLSTAPTLTTATFAAGTISASTPNTITQTWNNAAVTFQALVVNATNNASGTLSSLIDLQVGGSSKFSVLKDGRVFYGPNVGVIVGSGMQWYGGSNASSFLCEMTTGGFGIGTNSFFGWTSRNSGIYQPVDHTYEFRGGTNPQSFRVYNTYTDASNYERLAMGWSGNVGYIGMERAGTGSQRYVIVDLGGNPSSGANSIRTVSTNVIEIWAGNTCSIRFGGNTAYIDYFQYYGAGAIKPSNYGISSAGNANRIADKFVFRALGGGTGNTATTYIGFGAAYVPAGIASTASHTQEDCFLVRLLASATPIVAFGSDFLSTVPAIKRTGTRLISRLADDSGYATWEGPLNSNTVNAIALPSVASVTAASSDGTTVTYTAANTFSVGQSVAITGFTTSTYNITGAITSASATQFTLATVAGSPPSGTATGTGTATIQSAGNSVTISGGNGSGVGAGGNIILQPGAQGTSGGDGIVQCTKKLQFYTGSSKTDLAFQINNTTTGMWYHSGANMFVWTINGVDSFCVRQGYVRLPKSGSIYFSNTTNDPITLGDDTGIIWSSRGVFTINAPMQGVNSQGGSLAYPSFTTTQAANVNDWVMGPSAFQRVNCTTASAITGIAPYTSGVHVDGRMIRIYNVGAANLTLAHNSTSTTGNKFYNATGADIILAPNDYAELIYDSTNNGSGSAGWRVS